MYIPTTEDKARYAGMNVVIVTPCKDYEVPFLFARCVANMIAYSYQNGLKVGQFGGTERMVVHWARNALALQAKEYANERGEKYTHVLWLDDDQTFAPDLLCVLASSDKDIISALYYSREPGKPYPVVYVKDGTEGDDRYRHSNLIVPPETVCEVDAVGFGAVLMRREVLEKVPSPWFRFNGCGEDVYFCVNAREAGYKIWLDGRYKLGHIGDPHVVGVRDYDAYMMQHRDELGKLMKVAL